MTKRNTEQPAQLRKFDGRTHVTARFLCGRFGIDQTYFKAMLDSLEEGNTALIDGTDTWIDATLFYDIANTPELSPHFSETAQQSMLLLLGHFDERPAGVSV